MKKRLVLIAGVCLAASCLPAHAQKAKGEDALPFIAATPLPPEAAAAQADAARALLKRVLPKDAAKFQMEVIPAEIETIEVPREKPRPTAPVAGTTAGTAAGTTVPVRPKPPVLLPPLTFDVPHDVFEIQTQNGVTVLRGNNGVALASALNYFLKYYGGSMLTWDGFDQINLPTPLPPVTPKVHAASPHQLRLAYQTATFGYATAYWQWDKWEREIDFLALSGINRALLPIGQEAVWMATWKQFGYSDDDIRKWLVAPGHAPWQTMGNMENTGPALPQSVIDARLKLAQKIAARMRELGIEPVLPGYIGIVPPDFKKHSADAVIVGQGQWVPGVKRPDVLDQSTPLYTDIAAKYYAAQKELLGTSSAYAADPFNDKGKKGDINDGDAGKAIYAAIDAASPGALWVLMGTLDQPAGGLTFGVPKNKTLILDLAADRTELWKDRKGFDKVPWLWCAMNNEGGRTGMVGKMQVVANASIRAKFNAESGKMSGIGFTPQGFQNNAAFWDMALENCWRDQEIASAGWMLRYPRRRYGQTAPGAERAWGLLRAACYDSNDLPVAEVVTARPYFVPPQTKPDDDAHRRADAAKIFGDSWRNFNDAADQLDKSSGGEAYRHDLAEVGAQALEALAGRYQVDACRAFRARDKDLLKSSGEKLTSVLRDMDELLATRREFLAGAYFEEARRWGGTNEEKALLETDARTLLTTWSLPASLRDAGRRRWAGLVSGYYQPRWEAWLRALNDASNGNNKLDDKKLADQWGATEESYAKGMVRQNANPVGDTAKLSKQFFTKYAAEFDAPPLMAVRTVTGNWSPDVCSTDRMVWLMDVSQTVTEAKDYEVEFKFAKGESGLQLYRVSLMQGARELAADPHPGYSGANPREPIYKLKAGRVTPGQPVLLRCEVSADVSFDSNGEIQVRRAKRVDTRPVGDRAVGGITN